jgi:hypothetical protein
MTRQSARTVEVPNGSLVLAAGDVVDDIYGDVGRPRGAVAIRVMPSWDAPEMNIHLPVDWDTFSHDELLVHLQALPELTTLLRERVTH